MTLCILCKKPAYDRCYSEAGRREVGITGMCELCFDLVTKEPEEETVGNLYDPHGIETNPIASIPTEYAFSREHAEAKAEKLGLTIVEPDAHTLQLDFDTEEQWTTFLECGLPRLVTFLKVERVWWTESKSGNKHVYVRLVDELSTITRIALQAALGSDPTRELLSIMRYIDDAGIMTAFFEKPDAVDIVIYATDGWQPQLEVGAAQLQLTAGEPVNDIAQSLFVSDDVLFADLDDIPY